MHHWLCAGCDKGLYSGSKSCCCCLKPRLFQLEMLYHSWIAIPFIYSILFKSKSRSRKLGMVY
ncbi:hypothetical protein C8R41DRAFT_509962 [Lentinula lateritia]|uniref:Uncharacterized protein n=1 Tax=Lentinula lateritia TaxID=40482 RepID=A0ABQ8VBC1_9AGAR|nr:hypothetical protein C8R41DRAFT_509962 [Lentinula lateritia]